MIGAGLAGAAVCARFAARGWHVDLIDQNTAPAQGASGNHAASFHPLIARDNNRMVRLTRAGIGASLDDWRQLERDGFSFSWSVCGVLQLARAGAKQDLARTVGGLALDPAVARAVDQAEASDIAGIALCAGGVLFGAAGWVQPASLVQAQLARCGAQLTPHFGRQVAAVRRCATHAAAAPEWELLDQAKRVIARTPVVVLAGGDGADLARLFGQTEWPILPVRGQITLLDAGAVDAPRIPVHGAAYVLPAIGGRIAVGATYDRGNVETIAAGHQHNLANLQQVFATPLPHLDMTTLAHRVSTRAVAPDRLPVIGQLVDAASIDGAAILRAGARLKHLPRLPGVYAATAYASRGLTWAALGAELLLALIEGAALPLTPVLADAVDPGRFALRAVRRRL